MSDGVSLNILDLTIFIVYILATVALGFWVARKGRGTAQGYFLGNKTIPWFVVGTSMVATDISSEHFISNVGGAYKHGIVLAAGDWNAWIIYSLLILVFLPYYVRTGLYTMPEFLERRYNSTCRYIFSVALVIGYVSAIIAGALYAGGLMLDSFFGIKVIPSIIFFAIVTGIYTIYGGLRSAAWTDFMQMVVLLFAGVLVPILALKHVGLGSIGEFMNANPEHFQMFKPPTHKPFPFTGLFTGFLTVGLWYSCTSQHMVQRVLGARDEWHARVGVVCAGFLHIIMPFFFIIPGIIAFKMYPGLKHPDQAYLKLVQDLIPTGLKGLLLAGMGAALMSTVATVLNSASTLVAIDLYKNLLRRNASESQQVSIGRWSGVVILIASIWIAISFTYTDTPLFEKVQNIFFYIAPPFAVVFTLGILWRRANATGALTTIVSGFIFTWTLEKFIFPNTALAAYNTYNHRALGAWIFCMSVMIVVSLLTSPPPKEKTDGIIWNRSFLMLPADVQARHRGWQDWRIWWLLFVGTVLAIYGFFIYWRIQHPW